MRIARTIRKIRGGDGYEIGDVKTKHSRRTIKVRKVLLDKLDYSHEYLFTNTLGEAARLNTFRAATWEYRLGKAVKDGSWPKHRKPRIHEMRHTHASWLIHANVSPKVIHQRLGHSSIAITFDIYGHLFDSADESALAALDATLAG